MMFVCIAALALGVCLALFLPIIIPAGLMPYSGIIILCTLLFLTGAVSAGLMKKLNIKIFIFGYVFAALAAAGAVYLGGKLDLDIYPVCVLLISAAIFKNCADIFRFCAGRRNN